MEYSTINAVTKLAANDYELWTLTMPRDRIHEIRQQSPVIDGDMRRVFEKIPAAARQAEGVCNFLLSHSDGLTLFSTDMGEDFRERNRYNGSTVRGTREEIMAELRENLKSQGYALRPNALFQNVDVLETLQKIVEHNTSYYQTDFQYDKEKLLEAAGDRNGYRQFLWLSRESGTWCFPERDVYIENTSPHNTWEYYGGSRSDHVKAFWIELHDRKDDKVLGDILEIDYQKHLDYLCTHSFAPKQVEVVFKHPNDCRLFDYQEYNQNWQSISQRYGTVERTKFLTADSHELARAVIEGHSLFWDAVEPMEIEDYVKRLDRDRLHDYGYTADDLILTGPMDADVAVRHGLTCYALSADGTKDLITGSDDFRTQHYSGKLFGMEAGEKEVLWYFKQECTPLFTSAEMREICSLAVQAGMENDPAKSALLDGIIHKAECFLPTEERMGQSVQEQAVLPDDIIR